MNFLIFEQFAVENEKALAKAARELLFREDECFDSDDGFNRGVLLENGAFENWYTGACDLP